MHTLALAFEESKAPHYEGMAFARADIDAAARDIDAYTMQHVLEL